MQSRDETRTVFFDAWYKYKAQEELTPMQEQLVQLIEAHPEYLDIFNHPEKYKEADFKVADNVENPFLHLGCHYTILEQVSLDQPQGIRSLYEKLVKQTSNVHDAEHQIMGILGKLIWKMLKEDKAFDQQDYLKQIKQLIR